MSKHVVEIQEILSRSVVVEAEDPEQAIADVMIGYYECMYILDSQDFKNVKFNIKENEQ